MSISNKTVIITGAAGGLGSALVKAYLELDYNVVANGLNITNLEVMAARLENPNNLLLIQGDIGKPETSKKLFDKAIQHFNKVDILINNAGIFIAKPTTDYTEEEINTIINTNLKGFIYPSQAAANHMINSSSGHIINITASIAIQPNAKLPALLPVLVKGGINQATRALALELSPSNIQVNAIAPGVIDTPLHTINNRQDKENLAKMSPMEKIGNPQDIVDAALYLTKSKFVTGATIAVDGGASAGVW
ncbi:3-oxoacyl-ACP reductase [Gammaproteobacteria bacterium ESL0073]|nr:3-oxoacyl-ACP reductase [Gammaproteobacteria bacterium ESL0073]